MRHALVIALIFATAYAAPVDGGEKLEEKLKLIQDQLASLQRQLAAPSSLEKEEAHKLIYNDWQPQKRMVAWQPMKRNLDERQPLLHVIEARLSEVLRAGERLGVSPEEVLQDLRFRNQVRK
ncbi:hypothetical protein Q1695_008488 [Nippostrongylus brasiliensis]|nr:hypothetical protein Q1695_008488 [Nippostrongylus brasiliensis]